MKQLFKSDKFFFAMTLTAVIGELAFCLASIIIWKFPLAYEASMLLRICCVIGLYISYRLHSKNVMKCLMGALLMAQVIAALSTLTDEALQLPIAGICYPIFAILSLLLFINHLIINSDHHSNPAMISLNQIVVLLLIINNTVLSLGMIKYGAPFSSADPTSAQFIFHVICLIIDVIGFIGMTTIVVCIESRLDAYRIDRENAGWTEEKGYPKGYVHQKDRNRQDG